MAQRDQQRWQDTRSTQKRPFRPNPRCSNCGAEFWLLIPRQELCHECAWEEVQAHKAPYTADEVERDIVLRKLRDATEDAKNHKAIPLAEPVSDYARLAREASKLAARLQDTPQPPKPSRKAGKVGTSPAEWLPLARKKARAGWNHRKISQFLGLNRKEVAYWLSVADAEADRFIAAAEGKLTPGNKDFAGDPRLLWCYSKYESQCRSCQGTIFVGDRMVRLDEKWVHAKCAEAQGHDVVELERRSRVQTKLARKRTEAAA